MCAVHGSCVTGTRFLYRLRLRPPILGPASRMADSSLPVWSERSPAASCKGPPWPSPRQPSATTRWFPGQSRTSCRAHTTSCQLAPANFSGMAFRWAAFGPSVHHGSHGHRQWLSASIAVFQQASPQDSEAGCPACPPTHRPSSEPRTPPPGVRVDGVLGNAGCAVRCTRPMYSHSDLLCNIAGHVQLETGRRLLHPMPGFAPGFSTALRDGMFNPRVLDCSAWAEYGESP